jgi:molybdopterin/thiamine biosynthesis adenylyltransferase
MQAMEAIKLVAGVGESSTRLQVFDAKGAEWRAVKVKKDPSCVVCGK